MGDFSERDDRKIKNLLRDLNDRRLFKDVCKRIISASDSVQSNLELLRAVVEHPTISKWSKILERISYFHRDDYKDSVLLLLRSITVEQWMTTTIDWRLVISHLPCQCRLLCLPCLSDVREVVEFILVNHFSLHELTRVSMRLRGDKELMSLVMSSVRSSYVFFDSSKELQSDPEFIKFAVSYNGGLLRDIYYKSETLWDDEETVFSGIKNLLLGGNDGYSHLKFVSARLLHSELFAHRMLSIYPKGRLQYNLINTPFRLFSNFRDNKELMLSLILKSDTSRYFDCCSHRLHSDKEMLLAALSCGNYSGERLYHASA
jgi:hypothetical protein